MRFLRPRPDSYATSHPGPAAILLVIAVADTSLAYDLGTKVLLHAVEHVETEPHDARNTQPHDVVQGIGGHAARASPGSTTRGEGLCVCRFLSSECDREVIASPLPERRSRIA
ncbi:MAG: hypothetical protein WCJ18_08930 [Planctomycetota bacterium]